jgi:hypothetical protein
MIITIGATTNRYGRTPTPSTLHRIRATWRSALNAAIREGLLRDNPARYVEVPSPRRPHALVWTPQRVEAWKTTGERPAVAVWTVEQTATFLSYVAQDRLAVMWRLIALRGLRRGEAAGPRWADVDLAAGTAMIEQQRIANGRAVTVGPPKTAASRRLVALDRHTIRLLREHRRRQRAEQRAAGQACRAPATCSSPKTGHRRTQTSSPAASTTWSASPSCRRSGCTTCATAQPASRTALRRSQDGPGAARALQHRAHGRHLHQRPDRPPGLRGRGHREAGARRRGPQSRPPAPPKRSPGRIRWGARGRDFGTSREQAFRSSQGVEAGPPT